MVHEFRSYNDMHLFPLVIRLTQTAPPQEVPVNPMFEKFLTGTAFIVWRWPLFSHESSKQKVFNHFIFQQVPQLYDINLIML